MPSTGAEGIHTSELLTAFTYLPEHALTHLAVLPNMAASLAVSSAVALPGESISFGDGIISTEHPREVEEGVYQHQDLIVRYFPAPHHGLRFTSRRHAEGYIRLVEPHYEQLRQTKIVLPPTFSQVVERLYKDEDDGHTESLYSIETITPWVKGEPFAFENDDGTLTPNRLAPASAIRECCESLVSYYRWVIRTGQQYFVADLSNPANSVATEGTDQPHTLTRT